MLQSFLGSSGGGSFRSVVLDLDSGEITSDGSSRLSMETGAAFITKSARVNSAVLGTDCRLFAIFPVLHELSHGVVSEILVEVLVVNLDHRGVDAGAEALDLLESEKAISTGITFSHVIEILDSLDDLTSLQPQNLMRKYRRVNLHHESCRE